MEDIKFTLKLRLLVCVSVRMSVACPYVANSTLNWHIDEGFQASAAVWLRASLFWVVNLRHRASSI
jgi:hypothetical protein